MVLSSPLRRIATLYRELGLGTGILYAVDRVLQALPGHAGLMPYHLMAQPVTARRKVGKPAGPIALRTPRPGDPLLRQLPRNLQELARRFDKGGTCLALTDTRDGSLLGAIWLLPEAYEEPEHRCQLVLPETPRCMLDVDAWVAPRARGGRTLARLWDGANEYMHQHGVQWSLSRVSAFNTPSLRAHARLGARRVGRQIFLYWARTELLLTDQAPYLAFSRQGGPAPVIRLQAPNAGSGDSGRH